MAQDASRRPGRGLYGTIRVATVVTAGLALEGGFSTAGAIQMIPQWNPVLDPFIESMDTGVPEAASDLDFISDVTPSVDLKDSDGPSLLPTGVGMDAGKYIVRRREEDE